MGSMGKHLMAIARTKLTVLLAAERLKGPSTALPATVRTKLTALLAAVLLAQAIPAAAQERAFPAHPSEASTVLPIAAASSAVQPTPTLPSESAVPAASVSGSTESRRASEPMLSIFKENYIVTGFPLNFPAEYDTSDLAYQVSMRFNALQNIRGADWDLFGGFTEMALWDIYKPSNPFRCHTYTFGLYAYHPLSYRGDEVSSDILTGFEHRSNGLDSHDSRDLNYIFATYTRSFANGLSLQAMARAGASTIGNRTTMEMYGKYQGYVLFTGLYTSRDRRIDALLSVTPLFGSDIPANVTAEFAWKPVKDADWFWLTARYHFGYDENQLECGYDGGYLGGEAPDNGASLRHMIRFGLSLQPRLRSHRMMP